MNGIRLNSQRNVRDLKTSIAMLTYIKDTFKTSVNKSLGYYKLRYYGFINSGQYYHQTKGDSLNWKYYTMPAKFHKDKLNNEEHSYMEQTKMT